MQALRDRCVNVSVERVGSMRWIRGSTNLLMGRSATEGLFYSRRLRSTIQDWASQIRFDAVVVFCSSMGQYLALPELSSVPAIVDLVDVDSEKFFQYGKSATLTRRPLYKLEARRLRKLERWLSERATAVVLVSESEAELWRRIYPNDRTYAVPNGVDLDYFQPAKSDGRSERCIFVGALDYPPNIDAVCWFARQVWPEVRRRVPSATFAIVGRNPHAEVQRLANIAGIEVIGAVPDVRPHMAEASIAIAPLRIARGIQNKILEAMAASKPVVASPQSLQGLSVEHSVPMRTAETPQEWIENIGQLLANHSYRAELGLSGRQFVERHHRWNNCLSPLSELLERCIAHSPRSTLTANGNRGSAASAVA